VITMLGIVMMRCNSNTTTRFRIDLSKLLQIQIYRLCLLEILRQSLLFCKMMWLSKLMRWCKSDYWMSGVLIGC
jgi:hypothetical protein